MNPQDSIYQFYMRQTKDRLIDKILALSNELVAERNARVKAEGDLQLFKLGNPQRQLPVSTDADPKPNIYEPRHSKSGVAYGVLICRDQRLLDAARVRAQEISAEHHGMTVYVRFGKTSLKYPQERAA